jgi:hypothetical protein
MNNTGNIIPDSIIKLICLVFAHLAVASLFVFLYLVQFITNIFISKDLSSWQTV